MRKGLSSATVCFVSSSFDTPPIDNLSRVAHVRVAPFFEAGVVDSSSRRAVPLHKSGYNCRWSVASMGETPIPCADSGVLSTCSRSVSALAACMLLPLPVVVYALAHHPVGTSKPWTLTLFSTRNSCVLEIQTSWHPDIALAC